MRLNKGLKFIYKNRVLKLFVFVLFLYSCSIKDTSDHLVEIDLNNNISYTIDSSYVIDSLMNDNKFSLCKTRYFCAKYLVPKNWKKLSAKEINDFHSNYSKIYFNPTFDPEHMTRGRIQLYFNDIDSSFFSVVVDCRYDDIKVLSLNEKDNYRSAINSQKYDFETFKRDTALYEKLFDTKYIKNIFLTDTILSIQDCYFNRIENIKVVVNGNYYQNIIRTIYNGMSFDLMFYSYRKDGQSLQKSKGTADKIINSLKIKTSQVGAKM